MVKKKQPIEESFAMLARIQADLEDAKAAMTKLEEALANAEKVAK